MPEAESPWPAACLAAPASLTRSDLAAPPPGDVRRVEHRVRFELLLEQPQFLRRGQLEQALHGQRLLRAMLTGGADLGQKHAAVAGVERGLHGAIEPAD